jgi:hypothetical protein
MSFLAIPPVYFKDDDLGLEYYYDDWLAKTMGGSIDFLGLKV